MRSLPVDDLMGMKVDEEGILGKMAKKSKKGNKNEADAVQELSGCTDAVQNTADDSVKLIKEDKEKKKKRKKRKYEICGDSTNENDSVESVDNKKSKKMQKDKKKKIEVDENEKQMEKIRKKDKRINSDGDATEIKEASSEKTHTGGEDNWSLQSDAANEKVRVEADINEKMEKNKKKKKNKGLKVDENEKKSEKARKKDERIHSDDDATEIEEALNEKIHVEGGEKNRSLQSDDGKSAEYEMESRKNKKKRHKKNKNGDGIDIVPSLADDNELGKDKVAKGQERFEKDDFTEMNKSEETKRNKKKKGMKEKTDKDTEVEAKKSITNGDIAEMKNLEGNKNKDKKRDTSSDFALKNSTTDVEEVEIDAKKTIADGKEVRKKKNKKRKRDKCSEVEANKSTANGEETAGTSKTAKSKKVSFSDHVDVFPSSQGSRNRKKGDEEEDGLVRGKRFSKEEDELIKEAVTNYLKERGWDEDDGLEIILNIKNKVKEHPELKNCWKEIAAALPLRPLQSVYYRAHILFESGKRGWTSEDEEKVRKFHAEHGSDWKTLAEGLGKHRFHVKDKWRRIKLTNLNRGHWSQEEYEKLFNLVNMDLRMKVSEEKLSKHGMLRDNICWGAISDQLSTRISTSCCLKWYQQLTSPMVEEGLWDDVDDYRLLDELYSLDAACMEDVDWENLLEHRSGEVCRKRWFQMVKHIGDYGNKSFADQVEVLSKRYCPDMVEAREAYASKPAID